MFFAFLFGHLGGFLDSLGFQLFDHFASEVAICSGM